jgi:hypothetical protein
MSKPLTDDQLANVRQCTAYLAFEECDENERADLDAALARLDFLERKIIAADKVVDAVRTIAPLVAAGYDEVKP